MSDVHNHVSLIYLRIKYNAKSVIEKSYSTSTPESDLLIGTQKSLFLLTIVYFWTITTHAYYTAIKIAIYGPHKLNFLF